MYHQLHAWSSIGTRGGICSATQRGTDMSLYRHDSIPARIYACIRINVSGFICIISVTLAVIFVDNETQILAQIFPEKNTKRYAMSSTEEEEKKVTVNPRKLKDTTKKIDGDENVVLEVDNKRDKKPSPFQHSYEQRKRLLESSFLDLESTNKWKTTKNECEPIRGKTSYKL